MSLYSEDQLDGTDPIHETEDYAVYIGELRCKGDWCGLEGYLVANKQTCIIEGEVTIEYAAIKAANDLQRDRDDFMRASKRAEEEDSMSFDEMLEQLKKSARYSGADEQE